MCHYHCRVAAPLSIIVRLSCYFCLVLTVEGFTTIPTIYRRLFRTPNSARFPEHSGTHIYFNWVASGTKDSLQDAQTSTTTARKNNEIRVSSEINLPFSAEIAFDAFCDLPRQPMWADWLSSVEYVGDQGLSKWKMKFLGLRYSWNAASTFQDRPRVIGWESTSGLSNFGRVELTPHAANQDNADECHMKLTMTFLAPRVLVRLVGSEDGAIARLVEKRMLGPMLKNFRDIVSREGAQ